MNKICSDQMSREIGTAVCTGFTGTIGAWLFTTLNPAAGFVFGTTYYLSTKITRLFAENVLDLPMTKAVAFIADAVAVIPAIGISCGVMFAASVTMTTGSMAVVAVATLLAYGLMKALPWICGVLGLTACAGCLCCLAASNASSERY